MCLTVLLASWCARQMFLTEACPEDNSWECTVLTQEEQQQPWARKAGSTKLCRTATSPQACAHLCTLDVCTALPRVFLVPHSGFGGSITAVQHKAPHQASLLQPFHTPSSVPLAYRWVRSLRSMLSSSQLVCQDLFASVLR